MCAQICIMDTSLVPCNKKKKSGRLEWNKIFSPAELSLLEWSSQQFAFCFDEISFKSITKSIVAFCHYLFSRSTDGTSTSTIM